MLSIEDIKPKLVEFFYESEIIVETRKKKEMLLISIVDILFQLTYAKRTILLTNALLELFITIKQLDKERNLLLTDLYDMHFDIKNRHRLRLVLAMMERHEGTIYEPLMKVLISHNAKERHYSEIVSMVDKIFIMPLIKVILNHCQDMPIAAHHAVKLLLVLTKKGHINDERIFFKNLILILGKTRHDEFIFGTILKVLLSINESKWLLQIANETKTQLIQILSQSLFDFHTHPFCIAQAMKVIKAIDSKKNTGKPDLSCLSKLYDQFIHHEAQSIINEKDVVMEHELLLLKLNLFHEYEVKAFSDYFELSAVITINEKHLMSESDPLFLQYARFHVTILKYMFVNLRERFTNESLAKIVLPLNIQAIVERVAVLREKLLKKLKNRHYNIYQASILVCSLLESLYIFKQRPITYGKTNILYVDQPTITNQQLKEIVNFIDYYVFTIDLEALNADELEKQMFYHSDYQINIMKSLNDFIRFYTLRNECTVFFKIIYHFADDLYFNDITIVMRILLMKTSFVEIIGLAIYKFAIDNADLDDFQNFQTKLDALLILERKPVKYEILTYLITNLESIFAKMKHGRNRFCIFNYLCNFIRPGLNQKQKENL